VRSGIGCARIARKAFSSKGRPFCRSFAPDSLSLENHCNLQAHHSLDKCAIQQRTLMGHDETGEEIRKPTHAHTESSPALSYIHAHKYTNMHLNALHTQRAASPKHVPALFDVPAHLLPRGSVKNTPSLQTGPKGQNRARKNHERETKQRGMRHRRCAELRLEAAQTGSGQHVAAQAAHRLGTARTCCWNQFRGGIGPASFSSSRASLRSLIVVCRPRSLRSLVDS